MDIETIHATRANTPESYTEYASWYYGKAILGTRTSTKTESGSDSAKEAHRNKMKEHFPY